MTTPQKETTSSTTSTEKPDDGKALLNKTEGEKDVKAQGAPEKYETFKVPEGQELDEKFASEAGTTFKELGLTQTQAQSLVDLYSKKALEIGEAPYKMYTDMRNGWRNEVVKNPALGDGTSIKPEVKATIGRAIDSLGDAKLAADFKQAMDLTGAGDHPAFVKVFHKLSQMLGEGTSVSGKGPSPLGQRQPGAAPKSAAAALYPNLPTSSG